MQIDCIRGTDITGKFFEKNHRLFDPKKVKGKSPTKSNTPMASRKEKERNYTESGIVTAKYPSN
jgi:hypothetical protein